MRGERGAKDGRLGGGLSSAISNNVSSTRRFSPHRRSLLADPSSCGGGQGVVLPFPMSTGLLVRKDFTYSVFHDSSLPPSPVDVSSYLSFPVPCEHRRNMSWLGEGKGGAKEGWSEATAAYHPSLYLTTLFVLASLAPPISSQHPGYLPLLLQCSR